MGMTVLTEPATNECECLPLAAMGRQKEEQQPMTPVTPELEKFLRAELAGCFPRSSPISLLLMHISQLERAHISPQSAVLRKRHRFHAPRSFLEQVLANMRRGIRGSDQIIVHGGAGVAIIFPGVDREGAFSIIERIYNGINLLQPETVIPPLTHETDIFVGMSSYPEPATSLEMLLHKASYVVHRLTLRPAVNAQFHSHRLSKRSEERRIWKESVNECRNMLSTYN
jgi:GGDEF domain-containing protein